MSWVTIASAGEFFREHLIERTFAGQELWRLGAALLALVLGFLAGKVLRGLIMTWGKRAFKKLEEESVQKASLAIARPVAFGLGALGIYLAVMCLRIPPDLEALIGKALKALVVVVVAYGAYRLIDLLEAFLGQLVEKTETKLDDMLLPIVRKSLKVFVVIIAGLTAADTLGVNVKAMLAGLGIGGLALALAAKDTLANLFGSIMIFTDQPFKIGERIKLGDADGPVEEVGLRSTKIRTLDGHLVTVPNSIVANSHIENIAKRPTIKRLFKVGVTYGTGYGKMQRALEIIREILDETEGLEELRVVRFLDFAAYSLDILVIFWVTEPDYLGKFLPTNEKVNLEILRRFDAEGIQIAFPTRTVHVVEDKSEEAPT